MADSKITGLPAIASVAAADLFVVVDDVAGTPTSTKATADQVGAYIETRSSLAELIRDTIGTALVDGTGIDVVVDDGAETITINATGSVYTDEMARDAIGTALTAGTGITVTPNDGADTITIAVTESTYQPLDSDLTTIASLTATTDTFLQSKSSAWTTRTPTEVTADLIAMVGDSGSGGTKGLVPAPAAGDAAAGKYLDADGTWTVPPGGGGGSVSDTAYASSWNGVTTDAPSKNAVYDKLVSVDASLRPAFIVGNWYAPIPYASYAAGAALVQDSARFIPFVLQHAITISDLGARITTLHAANNIQLAIYANNATTIRPTGSDLAATGNITTASTGAVSADIAGSDVTLQPGLYWMGVNSSGSTVVCQTIAAAASLSSYFIGATALGTVTSGGTSMVFNLSTPLTFGTWGDLTSATWTQNATNAYAVVFMKAA